MIFNYLVLVLEASLQKLQKLSKPQMTAKIDTILDVFAIEIPSGLDAFAASPESGTYSPPKYSPTKHSPLSPTERKEEMDKLQQDFIYQIGNLENSEYQVLNSGFNLNNDFTINAQQGNIDYFSIDDMYSQYLQISPNNNSFPYLPVLPQLPTLEYQPTNQFQQVNQFNQPITQYQPIENASKKRKIRATEDLEGDYSCPKCPKKYTTNYNLKAHIKTHSGTSIFNCDECDSTFQRSHDLKRHVRSLHTNTRAFECIQCEKRFSRLDALKRHVGRVGNVCYQRELLLKTENL